MSGNYPAGVNDNDPHFDLPSVGDDDCENAPNDPTIEQALKELRDDPSAQFTTEER